MIRLTLTLNVGPRQGDPLAAILVRPDAEAVLTAAANKLRLKKKDVTRARLFVWRAGVELPREGTLEGHVRNGDTVAVSLGEEYAGPRHQVDTSGRGEPDRAVSARWSLRSDALAVVEWADARTMNDSLGRMSTLLEHPVHCADESPGLVDWATQGTLPSNAYLGHNLYAAVLEAFEARAAAVGEDDPARAMSEPERSFLRAWREHGAPAVVISHVTGAHTTLAHELCHARYALEPAYRDAANATWQQWGARMGRWMSDLGYHSSRHADEFAAYALTEPAAFWRGRLEARELNAVKAAFPDPPAAAAAVPGTTSVITDQAAA